MRFKCLSLVLLLAGTFAYGQAPQPQPAPNKVFATGRLEPKNLKQLHEQSHLLYGHVLKNLPRVTAQSWDCVALGLVGPMQNQGNCGSCWDFSGTDFCTSACYKSGIFKNDGINYLSQQFILDCVQSGGCNGDDNTTVAAACKNKGMPLQVKYTAYHASSGRCQSVASTDLIQIKDWGFCTTSNQNGVAAVQDIKNCMVAYGVIGSAIAANDSFMNVQPGQVFHGNSHSINHDITLVGWDDSKSWAADMPEDVKTYLNSLAAKEGRRANAGAWKLRNSWGTSWCDGGYCWIAYGANDVGTEAVWATAGPPPTPPAAPVITSATSAPAVVGTQFLYQIVASNSPGVFGASGLPAGLTLATDKGVITGIPTTAGTFNVTLSAANVAGVGTAPLVITVTGGPIPPGPGPGPAGSPVITSATTATVAPGAAFSYQIAATNSPIAYNAANLPAGLTVSQSSGLVTGTVATAGTYSCQVMALNFVGVGTSTLTLTVGTGPVPGNVQITLTPQQVQDVIRQAGAIQMKPGMTMQEFVAEFIKCAIPAPPMPAKSLKSTTAEPPLAPDADDEEVMVRLLDDTREAILRARLGPPLYTLVDRRLMPRGK